ncbi:unnamed protein product [Sphagnum jensenii]|uniref:Uncharacterized protein n=1 Tax=Sphagnum jensenii TaxID=128206 RepID=A0ABP1BMF9_9BRYO
MRPNKKQKANAGLHNDDDDDHEEHEVVDHELGFEWVHGSDESSQGDSGRDTGFDQFVAMTMQRACIYVKPAEVSDPLQQLQCVQNFGVQYAGSFKTF